MVRVAGGLVLFLAALAGAEKVTPVEKVITLLEDLKTETEEEGKTEAKTYDTFTCFCKDTTEEKSDAIKTDQDNIEELAATLQEQTSIKNAKIFEMQEMDQLIAKLDKDMAKMTAVREKEKTRYEAQAADLGNAVTSLEGSISNLKAAMPASLAQVKSSLANPVRKALLIADTLDVDPTHSRKVAALLQEDPEMNDGEFHSDELIATFERLLKSFKARKSQVDQREGENAADFADLMGKKEDQKSTAKDSKSTAEGEKETAIENIADASKSTVEEEAKLKDDELYMKDLTEKCELKAREWDQRSSMRAGEVTALGKAIEIISQRALENSKAGKRALLLQSPAQAPKEASSAPSVTRADVDESDIAGDALSFLQMGSPRKQLAGLAKQVATKSAQVASRRERALAALVQKAEKLKSPVLSSLAMKVAADPFLKVKRLVQELIERLVKEAAAESSKKGWCDTSMGKATSNRNSNHNAVMTINGELEAFEAKKASLEQDITNLTTELSELNDSLAKQTKLRTEEKDENMDTLDKSKAGLAAVMDAYDVLKSFYKQAAKGKVSLVQASPVDEDAPAVHGGAYKGNQQKAGGIFAMLDVIVSDFERTIRVVSEAEKEAHAAFVEFERTTKSSIMSAETGKTQAEQDLKSTDQSITESMEALSEHQKLLDDALKELEELKPTCVDTGMSYEERVAKREEEIDALKSAMCQLDAEGVEADC